MLFTSVRKWTSVQFLYWGPNFASLWWSYWPECRAGRRGWCVDWRTCCRWRTEQAGCTGGALRPQVLKLTPSPVIRHQRFKCSNILCSGLDWHDIISLQRLQTQTLHDWVTDIEMKYTGCPKKKLCKDVLLCFRLLVCFDV